MACGKRWDLAGPALSANEEADDPPQRFPKRSGADLIARVMSVAKAQPATQKNETAMDKNKCTKPSCHNEAAEDSVLCPKHRDAQRASNEKFKGRAGKPKRTYTRRNSLGGGTALSVEATMPATRTHAPITLAEPTIVNGHPPRRVDLDGQVLTVLDGLIAQRETELAMLRGTKEILERHG